MEAGKPYWIYSNTQRTPAFLSTWCHWVLNQTENGNSVLMLLFSFHSDRLGQISGEVNIISSENSQVEGKEL